MKWHGKVEVIMQNKGHTVGIVKVEGVGIHKLVGYWNKEILLEAIKVLELLDYDDVEMSVIEDENNEASMILFRPAVSKSDWYVAVAGKTEAQS